MLRPLRRAIASVSDKTGLTDLARTLTDRYGVSWIATGGTARHLAAAGLPIREVSDLTGFPEILDGRVKTLHPALYAGILARRDRPEHRAALEEHRLPEIDLVVCNLYPFEQTIARPGTSEAEAVEMIDIGGPCLVRAAAKNYADVAVLVNPSQYDEFLQVTQTHNGQTPLEYRRRLAATAFAHIEQYDAAIADYFDRLLEPSPPDGQAGSFPPRLRLRAQRRQTLRYGENPHQSAALYLLPSPHCGSALPATAYAEQLHGKELSYNNWLDLDAAYRAALELLPRPACVVVKHNNPCGAATAPILAEAFRHAWDGDPLAAFGGIVACNRPIDGDTAAAITDSAARRFIECLIAPDYEPAALDKLRQWKEGVRLVRLPITTSPAEPAAAHHQGCLEIPRHQGYYEIRSIGGGYLLQTADVTPDDPSQWRVVSERLPTPAERAALEVAWRVCKHVKSNAIVLVRQMGADCWAVVGVGAGQMSRVDAVHIAVRKAGERAAGAVLASDAFFPFADNVEAAAAAGITAIIQPGGSIRDADSIAAANRHGLAMLFTGVRHFRH